MNSILHDYAKRIGKDEASLREALLEDKECIKRVYALMVEDIIKIRNKAVRNNFAGIRIDLQKFIDDLIPLKTAFPKNHQANKDIDELVQKIKNFIAEYNSDIFTNNEERLSAFVNSMIATFKSTILRDILKKDMGVTKLIEDLSSLTKVA